MAIDQNRGAYPRRNLLTHRRQPGSQINQLARKTRWQDYRNFRAIFSMSAFAILYMSAIGFGAAKGKSAVDLSSGNGDWLQQVVYFLLLILVLWASLRTDRVRALFCVPFPLVLALAWCWLSVFWAIEPQIAIRRIVLTTLIVWIVFRSVDAVGYDAPMGSARSVILLTLFVNYFYVLFMPSGIHHGIEDGGGASLEGAWKGIAGHKNFAGAICSFTILIFCFDSGRIKRWVTLCVIAASGFFLYMTQSKTSEGILAAALLVGFACLFYNSAYKWLVGVGLIIGIAVIAMFTRIYWYEITHPFFYPNDFTNRGQIWNVLFGFTKENWLLGSGYGSFWNIGFKSPVYLYITKWQMWIPGIGGGHNGYFDLLASIGLPGLVLAVFATLIRPAYILATSDAISRAKRALMASTLTFCAGHNLTETSLLDRDSLVNVFMMLIVALIYKTSGVRRHALMSSSQIAGRSARFDRLASPLEASAPSGNYGVGR